MRERNGYWIRVAVGAVLGAVLSAAVVYFWWGTAFIGVGGGRPVSAFGLHFWVVMPEMAQAFGSAELAALVQLVLGGAFGAVVALATLPFADDGRELVVRSLGHFGLTALTFALLHLVCRWNNIGVVLIDLLLLSVLYFLIWVGRWIGWYVEVAQLRALLGLDPGPTPLKWRETLPYLPFILLVCDGMPVLLRGLEKLLGAGGFPLFTGLLYPYLILPIAGACSGLSLGKRQGVCPLYPVACFVCYLPMVWLLFNESALFHCFLVAVPALAGNVMGWLYRRAVPKKGRL